MRSLIEWFARNHVAVNMLTLFLIVAGIISIIRTDKEVIPDIDLDWVTIAVAYPGASPTDIEEAVCKKIETAIHDIDGIKKVNSRASEHFGTVFIESKYNYDSRKLYEEVKARVDALQFPPNALRPVIRQTRVRNVVAKLAVHGPADPESLKNIAEQVKKDLVALPGISQVELEGVRPYEISIEASEADLQRYNMSLLELADAIRKSSADLPGGVIKTESGNVALIAQGQMYWGDQFEQIVVRSQQDGGRVLVGDVARVHDGFSDGVNEIKFNGEPAILLRVFQAGGEDILKISNQLTSYVQAPTTPVPEGIKLTITQDRSELFKSRMDLLLTNAWQGLLLVFFMILLMMRFRFAIFVVIGIPVSFMGTIMMLDYLGVSINMISLFGFV
ncbi:MAG TPA: efflux RND transporter permease subunit, partial [Pseudomonadales bacterium]|nr:efflux RND transporter permease subunit [Pseudomonadales bacterium]